MNVSPWYIQGGLDSLHLWMLEHGETTWNFLASIYSWNDLIKARKHSETYVKHKWNHWPPTSEQIWHIDTYWICYDMFWANIFWATSATTCSSHIFLRLHAWDERHLMYRLITWRRLPPRPSPSGKIGSWWMANDEWLLIILVIINSHSSLGYNVRSLIYNGCIINISIMIIIYYLIWIIL